MRNSRRGAVDPFIVMDVMEAARRLEEEGRHLIHMEVGQPGTGAPRAARERLARAMEEDTLGYTVALGRPDLRAGIAALYGEWYDIDLDPARVVITAGASGGFLLAFSALFDAGQKVGMGLPCYPSYRQILKAMSLDVAGLRTDASSGFQPRPDQITEDLAGLILASPANPTGTMIQKPALAELAAACAARDVALISDEIYHGLHYEARAVSALEVTDQAYIINSFSKYFSMTGWRLGWMVVPEDHLRVVERLAQNMFICAPHASQVVALAAMECREELIAYKAVYEKNRRLMIDGLPEAGFDRIAPPDGAFYIYADISHLTSDSLSFAREILQEAGVAVTPGLDFDTQRGAGSLRFSYAGSSEDIQEGLHRLRQFMQKKGFAA